MVVAAGLNAVVGAVGGRAGGAVETEALRVGQVRGEVLHAALIIATV